MCRSEQFIKMNPSMMCRSEQFIKMNQTVRFQLSATKLLNTGDPNDLPDPFFKIRDVEGINRIKFWSIEKE